MGRFEGGLLKKVIKRGGESFPDDLDRRFTFSALWEFSRHIGHYLLNRWKEEPSGFAWNMLASKLLNWSGG